MERKVVGIYLAAGKSKRMGCNKLVLKVEGRSLGSIALSEVVSSKLDHLFIVTRENDRHDWIDPTLYSFKNKWEVVISPNAWQGQSSSLKAGIREASYMSPEAIIIFLADQPFISSESINLLINSYLDSKSSGDAFDYISAHDNGVVKPPILFHHSAIPKLLMLQGDEGARRLIRNGNLKGKHITVEEPYFFLDVDTQEDYRKVQSLMTHLKE